MRFLSVFIALRARAGHVRADSGGPVEVCRWLVRGACGELAGWWWRGPLGGLPCGCDGWRRPQLLVRAREHSGSEPAFLFLKTWKLVYGSEAVVKTDVKVGDGLRATEHGAGWRVRSSVTQCDVEQDIGRKFLRD